MTDSDAAALRKQRFKRFGAVLGVVAVIAGGVTLYGRGSESTDDAAIDATVALIAPQVAGRVLAVHFNDNDKVEAGQVLVELDPADYQTQYDAAKANRDSALAKRDAAAAALALTRVTAGADYTRAQAGLEEAQRTAEASIAEAERADADVVRYRELFAGHNASRQRLDQAVADSRAGDARRRAAQAAIAQARSRLEAASTSREQVAVKEADFALAEAGVAQADSLLRMTALNLSYTKIVAPAAGRAGRRAVSVGDVVAKGQPLTQLVVGPLWVTANFKESQLTRMRAGQPATVSVDAYPGRTWTGHVESVQPATGARFSLLPPENATGNFVKIVQRVPVKIALDPVGEDMPELSLGMSAVPEVRVR